MREIVVGVDGSEPSAAALRWAAREAAWRDEPLVAVLGWSYLYQHHVGPNPDFDPAYDEERARAALASYVHNALGDQARAELRTVCDLPGRGLVEAAKGASMLVVGARGLGGFKGLLVGSCSQHCLHHATSPVAVVRSTTAPHFGDRQRIVVGTDGSDAAMRALEWAVDEAQLRDADLVVVHAWQLPITGPYPYMGSSTEVARYEADARALLDHAADGLSTSTPPTKVLRSGSPANAILEAGELADLIVVGSRGAGGVERFLLGSTSSQVVHHARCPVVVVPSPRSNP